MSKLIDDADGKPVLRAELEAKAAQVLELAKDPDSGVVIKSANGRPSALFKDINHPGSISETEAA